MSKQTQELEQSYILELLPDRQLVIAEKGCCFAARAGVSLAFSGQGNLGADQEIP